MSPHSDNLTTTNHCFPRVSEDEPIPRAVTLGMFMFSPRERG